MAIKLRETYDRKSNFLAFVKELEKLSLRYGVTLDVTGGVYQDDPKEIENVHYSTDHTSGDLSSDVKFK